jgi:hypothetical protein
MAELGSINTTDTNRGVTPVTRESDLAALNAGLNLTGKVITEAAKTDIRNDLKEDADDAIAASDQALDTPVEYDPLTEEGLADSGLDLRGVDESAIINFTNEMRSHQAIATQAKDNASRTRATQQMQRTLQQAKQKYPWLRDTLQAEASAFMSSSADLTELGLRDAAVGASNAAGVNTDYIDELKKRAYGTGALDLKMDPRIQIGTAEFSIQYSRKMAKKQAEISLSEDTAFFTAMDKKDARKAADITRRHLTAPEGGLMQTFEQVDRLVDPLFGVRQAFAAGTATRGELAAEQDNWNRNVKPQIDRLLERTIIEMQTDFNNIWAGNLANEPEAEANRALLNTSIENVKMMRATLDGDIQDVKMMLSTLSHVAVTKKFDDAPALRDLNDFIEGTPLNMIDTVDKWAVSNSSAYDLDNAADGLNADLMQAYPNIFVSAQEVSGMSPEQARAQRRENRTLGVPGRRVQSDVKEQVLKDSMGMIENVVSEAKEERLSTPVRATAGLVTYAKYIEEVGSVAGGISSEEKQVLRDSLADEATLSLINTAGRDSTQAQQLRLAYEEDIYGLNGKDSRAGWADEIRAIATSRIAQGPSQFTPGFSLMNLVNVEPNQIAADGSIVFTPDNKAIEKAVIAANPAPAGMAADVWRATGSIDSRVKQAQQDAARAAAELSAQVTTYTRAAAHLTYLKDKRYSKPQYLEAFMDVGAESQGMNDLFTVFRN